MAHAKDGHKRTSSNHHAHTTSSGLHHARRKSNNASTAELARLKRPAGALSRRVTPASMHKLGRVPKEKQREWTETTEEVEDEVEEERESFPQYCMACEKEFVPYDNTNLYCSDACRADDESPSGAYPPHPSVSTPTIPYHESSSYPYTYTISRPRLSSFEAEPRELRDIIPRAAPSRPSSMNFSVSPPLLSPLLTDPATYSTHSSHSPTHTSAISALRSVTHPSPPSPTSASSLLWRPWKSSPVPETPTSASKRSSGWFAATLDSASGGGGYGQYGYHYDGYGMDRPLAPRKPGTSVRPKSIELVTPLTMGRWDS